MGASASKHKTHGSKRDGNRIPDRPSPPGKPQLVPGTNYSEPDIVTITWDPPEYDGGAKVTGYLVEHRRTGSPHWVRASPTLVRVPELTLSGLEPGWRYQFRVSAKNSVGMSEPGELSELLTVTLQRTAASAPNFVKELSDIVALENEKAELTVQFRGTPTPTIAWYKDGLEIFSGRRHRIITENGTSTLIIHQTALGDEGEVKCTATNRVGHAVTKATIRTEAPPSIRLPRQYEDGLLFEKDEVMRLKVTIAGRPEPSINWLHNGEPLINSGRYEMTFTDKHATLRVDDARRSDRGEYQVKAVNQLGEDIASFLVTVTDRPQPPGKAKVVMTLGKSVTLSWTPPEDDGGCKIGNYIVEYYRLGWNMWLKAATCRQLTTTLGDLIEGSEYKFRVKAENPYGVSDPGEESDILFIPDPQRGLLQPPERRDGGRGIDEIAVEEWLLDPHKRQREVTPGGSPSRDHKKVKKKQEPNEIERRQINPENTLTNEDNGFYPKRQNSIDRDNNKEQQDAPKVPKRRMKRTQVEIKGNDDEEQLISPKIKVIDEGKTDQSKETREKIEPGHDFHGSSELMLVLLPHSRATTEERESDRKEIIDSLKTDSPGIAPPMSLSAPELGSIEPEKTLQRLWVSSTELLHERAMARFYQAVAEEEAEKSLRRRYSVERRSSSHTRELAQFIRKKSITGSEENLQIKAKNRLSLPEEILYKNVETIDKLSLPNVPEIKLNSGETGQTKNKQRNGSLDVIERRGRFQIQSSEEEDETKSMQESQEEELSEESEIEDEEYMAEAEEDYEMEEDEEYEEEEEEEEEEIDDLDKLGESEQESDERSLYSLEETYHPRSMKPKSGTVTTIIPESPKLKLQNISTSITDNLKAVTEVATAVVSHSTQFPVGPKTSQSKSLLKPPELPTPMVRIEVTPPPSEEVKVSVQVSTKDRNQNKNDTEQEDSKKYVIKPIIKKAGSPKRENSPTTVQFKIDSLQNKTEDDYDEVPRKKQFSPPRFTPDGRHLPNLNPPTPKPILKIREQSQERTFVDDKKTNSNKKTNNSAPIAEVEPELNIMTKTEPTEERTNNGNTNITDSVKLKKKQVRIEEPENRKSYIMDESDAGITAAGDMARNRRRSTSRSSSLVDASDPTKCLIHHYSDIVREFGKVRKVPTTLYLNYEDLKAAAQKSEDNVFEPMIESQPKISEEEGNNFNKQEKTKNLIEAVEKETKGKLKEVEQTEEEPNDFEFLTESSEIKEIPQLILMSEVFKKEKRYEETDAKEDEEDRENYEEEEQQQEQDEEEEPKSETKEENEITKIAKKKVRSFVDYMTDFAMFLIACWLYAFSDERLAIPILILMIYRQAKDATVSYVKRKVAKLPRLPKLPKLPWKNN